MTKMTIIIFICLLLVSCGHTKIVKVESWYKINCDSKDDTKQLIYKVFYNENGIKEKELSFNPSSVIYKKETMFNNLGLEKSIKTYFDSTLLFGYENYMKYNGDTLVEGLLISVENGFRGDTIFMLRENIYDSTGKLKQTIVKTENDTSIVDNKYSLNGLKSERTFSKNKIKLTNETFEYNSDKLPIKYSIELLQYNDKECFIYTYSDTLLTDQISINNGDTIKKEKYFYKNDLKNRIEVMENNINGNYNYVIEIEYEFY